MSYSWNTDERSVDCGLAPLVSREPEYVPVYKILKEMYDEDKARLYCISTESNTKPGLPILEKGLARYAARLVRKMDMKTTVANDFEELAINEEVESEPESEQEPVNDESEKDTQKLEDETPETPADDPDGISKRFWYT